MQLRLWYTAGVCATSRQSRDPAPSRLVLPGLHPCQSLRVSWLPGVTATPVPLSHLQISYSFLKMVSLRPYCAYKKTRTSEKVPFPILPLPEIQTQCTGMGCNAGIFHKLSLLSTLRRFQLASAQPSLVPAALTAPLAP